MNFSSSIVQPAISFPFSPNLNTVFVGSVESKACIPYWFEPKLPTVKMVVSELEPVLKVICLNADVIDTPPFESNFLIALFVNSQPAISLPNAPSLKISLFVPSWSPTIPYSFVPISPIFIIVAAAPDPVLNWIEGSSEFITIPPI